MGLETRIWASRLGFEPQDWDMSLEGGGQMEEDEEKMKKKREKEKFTLCVKALVTGPFGAAAQLGIPLNSDERT